MEKEETSLKDCYHLIGRQTLIDMIKMNYKLSNMLLVVTYACEVKKMQIMLSAEEVCEVLKITPQKLEECRRKNWIRVWPAGDFHYYKAYDIAVLAERINRRKVQRKLSQLPVIHK